MALWADRLAKLAQALATAGTVPDTSISTAETDVDLRLAPDGAGGVEWGTGGGGGGGGSVVGLMPIALQIGALVGSAPTTAQNLAAVGGAVGIPIVVNAPMVLEKIEFWNTDTSGAARSAEVALYVEDGANDGTAALVTGSDGSVAHSPAAASRVVITPSGTPTLDPGIYWLIIRDTHATATYGIGYAIWNATFWDDHASALIFTGLPALGATLDVYAAASQVGVARSYGARLQGTYLGDVV